MSAKILPLQSALDARRAKAQRRENRLLELFRMMDPFQKQYALEVARAWAARSRKETAVGKNVVDLLA